MKPLPAVAAAAAAAEAADHDDRRRLRLFRYMSDLAPEHDKRLKIPVPYLRPLFRSISFFTFLAAAFYLPSKCHVNVSHSFLFVVCTGVTN